MAGVTCFKAYDIRGKVPEELNVDIAFRLGHAFATRFAARRVAVGQDVRHSSAALLEALSLGLCQGGATPLDIGLCGTEEVYFAAFQPGIDGGIMVTASHNPIEYNGMKLVRAGAVPISGDSGLRELEAMVAGSDARPSGRAARVPVQMRATYVEHLLNYLEPRRLRPLRVVVNAGNGGAGLLVDALAPHLPFEFIRLHHEPDGSFPNGIPNPLLPENRASTASAVRAHRADLGVAWDGDFDRCFLFDETGEFVEGYYIVGLLAQALLAREQGARIIHDPRLTWNTIDMVQAAGGVPVQCKTGHAFIKERMRAENAIYGGEMSAHHYFRSFAYCDNGSIPWLLVAQLLSQTDMPFSALVGERQRLFPISGEINRTVRDVPAVLTGIEQEYRAGAERIDRTDGLSIEFEQWRFNLRGSNTEPLLRLNVEARGDSALVQEKTEELLRRIDEREA